MLSNHSPPEWDVEDGGGSNRIDRAVREQRLHQGASHDRSDGEGSVRELSENIALACRGKE